MSLSRVVGPIGDETYRWRTIGDHRDVSFHDSRLTVGGHGYPAAAVFLETSDAGGWNGTDLMYARTRVFDARGTFSVEVYADSVDCEVSPWRNLVAPGYIRSERNWSASSMGGPMTTLETTRDDVKLLVGAFRSMPIVDGINDVAGSGVFDPRPIVLARALASQLTEQNPVLTSSVDGASIEMMCLEHIVLCIQRHIDEGYTIDVDLEAILSQYTDTEFTRRGGWPCDVDTLGPGAGGAPIAPLVNPADAERNGWRSPADQARIFVDRYSGGQAVSATGNRTDPAG